jgi:hypothetical protein
VATAPEYLLPDRVPLAAPDPLLRDRNDLHGVVSTDVY